MDVNDPASSPSGAHFIPQLPPLGTEPIRPFLDSLELEFELHIRDVRLKDWTLKHFLLDDNQIYRKAETVRGIEYNQRYAACTYDSFDLITGTHRGLHHAGNYLLYDFIFSTILY